MPQKMPIKSPSMTSRLLCSLCFCIFSAVSGVAVAMLLLERLEEAAFLLGPERCFTSGSWIIDDFSMDFFLLSLVGHFLLSLLDVFFLMMSKDERVFPWKLPKKSDASFFQGRKSLPHCNSCRPTAPNITLKSHHVINSFLYPTLPKLPPINGALSTPGENLLKGVEKFGMSALLSPALSVFALPLWAPDMAASEPPNQLRFHFKSSILSADHRLFWFNLISWWSSWYLKTLFVFLWYGLPAFFVLDKVLEVFSRVFFWGGDASKCRIWRATRSTWLASSNCWSFFNIVWLARSEACEPMKLLSIPNSILDWCNPKPSWPLKNKNHWKWAVWLFQHPRTKKSPHSALTLPVTLPIQ